MPELSPEYKLRTIENLERAGITDIDYEDIIGNMESIMSKYSPVKSKGNGVEGFDYNMLKGMTPSDIELFVLENSDMLRDQYNVNEENIETFLSGLNQANIMPYRAFKTQHEGDKGGHEWGFYKNIDRYDKAYNAKKEPVYLRYYKDGTHDVLDEKTFNEEKYFNYLPKELKEQPMIRIDESSMSGGQKDTMYNRILSYQNGV